MDDATSREPGPRESTPARHTLSVEERIAVIEVSLRQLREQREREHGENRRRLDDQAQLLERIDRNASAAAKGVDRLENRVDRQETRIDGLEAWRDGLLREIRGAMRIPRALLAAVPIGMFLLGIVTLVRG